MSMALARDQFRNRVKAGAALRGLGLRTGLRDALEDFGADRTLYQTMYSDEKARELPRNLRDLSEALGLPREWFTEPDLCKLIPGATELAGEQVVAENQPAPPAPELEQDLEGAAQQSESSEKSTAKPGRASGKQ